MDYKQSLFYQGAEMRNDFPLKKEYTQEYGILYMNEGIVGIKNKEGGNEAGKAYAAQRPPVQIVIMTTKEIKDIVLSEKYDFLRTDPRLGDRIILLGLGGSYAYGTNVEGSDVDVRGIALNNKEELLLGRPFEQVIHSETDTTIYSFSKIVKLLTDANPNVLEMLFLDEDQYLHLSGTGKELIEKRGMFLSKKIMHSFGGYARAQLSRLDNKTMRDLDQPGQEDHILRSIQNASASFPEKYFTYPDDAIRLYIDDAVREDFVSEIFMDVHLTHYPLRDYKCMWSEMHNIVKDYGKIGKRAESAMKRSLCKHAMHFTRLQIQNLELFESGTMHTHCVKDHDLLMDIRNGRYMDDSGQMKAEFFAMVDDYDRRIKEAAEHSRLPDKPDYKAIDAFVCKINERIIRGEL